MELKKNPKYDVRRNSFTFFLGGLLFALSLTLVAFKYTSYDNGDDEVVSFAIEEDVEEMADITKQNEPPPPAPPPPPPATVEVVEDDVETPETDIPETDLDKDYKPTIAPPAPPEPEPENTGEAEIFEIVEDSPKYPGGETAMKKYIASNLRYPPLAVENQKQGRVYVQFVVEPDGSLSNVKAVKTFDDDCAAEAVKVVKSMPRWNPGKQRNKPVRVKVVIPIVFKLN